MTLKTTISKLTDEPGAYVIFGPITSYRYVGSTANLRENLMMQVNLLEKNEHPNMALQGLYNSREGFLDIIVQITDDIESATQAEFSITNYPVGPQRLMNTPEVYDTSIWNL